MTINKNTVDIHQVFQPLYTTKKRYIFITGGRGSLKSTTTHDFICRATYEQNQGILLTRFTMTSAEKSVIPEFKTTLKRLGVEDDFKIANNVATNLRTGSFILFSGIKTSQGDQTANLKSIPGITIWVVEEGEDFNDEKKFNDIDDSIRSTEHQNRIIWIQNPTTREHFAYERFIKPASKQIEIEGYKVTVSNMPDVEHIHTTYHIAERLGYLAESWLRKAKESEKKALYYHNLGEKHPQYKDKHRSHYYYNYIGGWLEKAEGVIFENWQEGEFNNSLPYGYGLDFGFFPDPNAMVKVAVDKRRKLIYLEEVFYNTKESTDDLLRSLANSGINRRDLIVGDASEPRTIKDISKSGYNIHKAKKGPDSVKNGIKKMQSYTLIVDPESHNLKKELNNYAWNDKKSSTPIDEYNHLIDATRYILERLLKTRSRGIKAG